MARIFSIDFDFQHQQYTALVCSQTGSDGLTRYVVLPNDPNLKQLFPEGKLHFSHLSDLKSGNWDPSATRELVQCIASALSQKLQPASG